MSHDQTNQGVVRDDDADLMGDDMTDEAREDMQSSLAGDDEDMSSGT